MKVATVLALSLVLIVIGEAPARAADATPAEVRPDDIQASVDVSQRANTFSRLAAAIAAGRAAMQPFHGLPSSDGENKDKLDPQIPGLDCYIDRMLNYVSCFGALIDSQEAADLLFTRFVGELEAVLPAEKWQGSKKEPGVNSVRSYVYADRKSDAHIDIDVVAEHAKDRDGLYVVSIFAWTY
jgi:hypothetical protein